MITIDSCPWCGNIWDDYCGETMTYVFKDTLEDIGDADIMKHIPLPFGKVVSLIDHDRVWEAYRCPKCGKTHVPGLSDKQNYAVDRGT